MKKLNIILTIIALVGQVLGLVGIFIAESNDQLMCSLWTFLLFGCSAAIIILIDSRQVKEKSNNFL